MPMRNITGPCLFLLLASWCWCEPVLSGRKDPSEIFANESMLRALRALEFKAFSELDLSLANVQVDQRGRNGETLLWWQANVGNLEAFEYLLGKGANPRSQISDGASVLELCAMQENVGFLKAALERGANPNAISQYKRETPIFSAIIRRRIDNVKLLIEAGACLDISDPMGVTPMILASDMGAYDIVVILLEAGANPFWQTIQGHNLAASLAEGRVEEGSPMALALDKARTLLTEAVARR